MTAQPRRPPRNLLPLDTYVGALAGFDDWRRVCWMYAAAHSRNLLPPPGMPVAFHRGPGHSAVSVLMPVPFVELFRVMRDADPRDNAATADTRCLRRLCALFEVYTPDAVLTLAGLTGADEVNRTADAVCGVEPRLWWEAMLAGSRGAPVTGDR